MARFDRPHYDRRGPEYDRRYGRYEGAFARRFAVERWAMERTHSRGRERDWVPPPPDKEFVYEDEDYSRRYWPEDARRELRRARRERRRR